MMLSCMWPVQVRMEFLCPRMLVLVFLSVPIVYHIHKRRKERQALGVQHGCLPPPLLENPRLFGLDRLEQIFRANAESWLMELFLFYFRQTGYILEQVCLRSPAFGTADPANLEAILSSHFKDFAMGPRREITFPMFGDGIFNQKGDPWKQSRELLRPQFCVTEYSDINVFKDATNDLLNRLRRAGAKFLIGTSTESLNVPELIGEESFAKAFDVAQEQIAKRFRIPGLYWLIDRKKFRDACKEVHYYADKIIGRSLAEVCPEFQGNYGFLQTMIEKTPDRTVLRSQIINILTAGRDTTACLLSWTFFLLGRHPKVLVKLRSEIIAQGDIEMSRSSLRSTKYLQNILKETLRLYPPVPVNTRTALRTTILPTGGGPDRKSPVLVPKGTAVAYSVYTMHRRPDLYGMGAELFRPERWDEDMPLNHDETNAKWGYLPFNGGPRICLGRELDFALVEAADTIVRIMQTFRIIKLPKGEKLELIGAEKQTITLVMSITEGCKVELM
ncbi:cytochrome P450 alkane hydroxylase [Cadophora sp. MPI-SDFR-AT-0126]|nr:cytochrome P450 alkane hydroxylase [Leotiomycetes sp. MPI-SDFR-AT-0126]